MVRCTSRSASKVPYVPCKSTYFLRQPVRRHVSFHGKLFEESHLCLCFLGRGSMRFHMRPAENDVFTTHHLWVLPASFDPELRFFGFRTNVLLFTTMQPLHDAQVVCVKWWQVRITISQPTRKMPCPFFYRALHLHSCLRRSEQPMHRPELSIVIELNN